MPLVDVLNFLQLGRWLKHGQPLPQGFFCLLLYPLDEHLDRGYIMNETNDLTGSPNL